MFTHIHESVFPAQRSALELSHLQNIIRGKEQDNRSFMLWLRT